MTRLYIDNVILESISEDSNTILILPKIYSLRISKFIKNPNDLF